MTTPSGFGRIRTAIQRAVQTRQRQASRDKLARLLLENSLDLIVSVDAEGRLLIVNPAAKAMLGYDPEELVGKSFTEVLHPDDLEKIAENFAAVVSGDRVGDVECRCIHRSGDIRHTLWSLVAEEGGVITTVGHDVTERKRAEDELRQERDYLDAVINSLPGIFFHYGSDMRILRWNRTTSPITGYSDDDIGQMHPFEFIAVDDREIAAGAVAEVLETGAVSGELRYRYKDGSEAPHLFNAVRFDHDGRPGIVGLAIDISERKRMEEELRKETALFEAMVENAPEGVLVVDLQNRTIMHNQRLKELWDIPPEIADDPDAVRLTGFAAGRTTDPKAFIAKVRWLVEHPEETAVDEIELVNGVILQRHSGPVVGRDGRHYGRIWGFRDITRYRDAQRRLRHLATHDALTGLANRSLIEQRIEQAIARAGGVGQTFAVLYVDLDRFKLVNDGYGHAFGDAVLKAVGDRLVTLAGSEAMVGRHGGDEFLILMSDGAGRAEAGALAQRIVDDLGEPVFPEGRAVHMSGSIGVSVFPTDGTTCQALIAHADAAMYRAKGDGRGKPTFGAEREFDRLD